MYWRRPEGDLSPAEYEAARLGFLGCLRRKRFSPQFIERHAEDLFGQACVEYTRALRKGAEIDNPPGWLIECAWRRTMSKLEAERSRPCYVSIDKVEPLSDEPGGSPENQLLDSDRWRKVRQAVDQLSDEQRQLLALSYHQGLPVREAARRLRWHPSKAQRAHEGARKRLHELLGVENSDDLSLEIGLAAHLSVAAEPSTGAIQKAAEGLASLRQQVADGGAQLKEHVAAGYYRAVDPTPLAAARPGTVVAVLAGCLAIASGGAQYCAERGVNPIAAARGLIASAEQPETAPSEPAEPTTQAPVYTPIEPPPEGNEPPPAQPTPGPAEAAPEPKPQPEPEPEPPPVEDSYEPVHTDYMAASEEEPTETYESPDEPAPVETSAEPAPVTNSAPQFGRPGGSGP